MNFSFATYAPFAAFDLPLIERHLLEIEDGFRGSASIAGSDTPSDLVSHVSCDRVSVAVSTADSDWRVTSGPSYAPSRAEWIYDSSNLVGPSRQALAIPLPEGAERFDMASQRSESSWAPIY